MQFLVGYSQFHEFQIVCDLAEIAGCYFEPWGNFTRWVSSRGSSVTMLVYEISEKGGKFFIKSKTEKPEKG